MDAYKSWVRENKNYLHSLESLANGMTWLLPERFSDSEVGPEAVTAVLGIMTAINQHIIDSDPARENTGFVEPHSFPYSLCISALKNLETLIEVAAEHYFGKDKKWNFIAATEATKVVVRLALFWGSGYKMLLNGGETPNVEKHSDASSSPDQMGSYPKPGGYNGFAYFGNRQGENSWNLEGRALSALSRFGENARMLSDPVWLHRVQHQHTVMKPQVPVVERQSLSTILSRKGFYGGLFVMGEFLFIIRPLIYVLFIRKYGVRSWIPWFLSLAVDMLGVSFLSQSSTSVSRGEDQKLHISASEKDEVKRRKLLFVLYLMRDPFFNKYTRQKLESTGKVFEPVPVVGFFTAKIIELILGAQTRYTYIAGS